MKRFLLIAALTVALGAGAYAVDIDLSDATVTITGPTTIHFENIFSMNDYYWADFEWNAGINKFVPTDYGLMGGGDCPSMAGDWIVYYDWGCDGSYGSHQMIFYNDGTWWSSEGYNGTWSQDGCNVEWWYESGTHYWGVMDTGGNYMEGEMLSYGGLTGCWWADRTGLNSRPRGNGESFTSDGTALDASK